MRWLVLLAFMVACKQKEEPAPEPAVPPTKPPSGHSVTKVKDSEETGSDASAGGSAAGSTTDVAPVNPDAADGGVRRNYGGDGSPAYRGADGQVHGPGGPIYMGRGPECTDKIDHCLRPGVWFACGNVVAGRLYRAVPVFELEDTWWTFRGKEAEYQVLFRTKVATAKDLRAGDPVVWMIEENAAQKWLRSEYDALTTSRWECGVIGSVGGDTFNVKGWDYAVPVDTARVIVEKKGG
jgi:hypothetical protein